MSCYTTVNKPDEDDVEPCPKMQQQPREYHQGTSRSTKMAGAAALPGWPGQGPSVTISRAGPGIKSVIYLTTHQ